MFAEIIRTIAIKISCAEMTQTTKAKFSHNYVPFTTRKKSTYLDQGFEKLPV